MHQILKDAKNYLFRYIKNKDYRLLVTIKTSPTILKSLSTKWHPTKSLKDVVQTGKLPYLQAWTKNMVLRSHTTYSVCEQDTRQNEMKRSVYLWIFDQNPKPWQLSKWSVQTTGYNTLYIHRHFGWQFGNYIILTHSKGHIRTLSAPDRMELSLIVFFYLVDIEIPWNSGAITFSCLSLWAKVKECHETL